MNPGNFALLTKIRAEHSLDPRRMEMTRSMRMLPALVSERCGNATGWSRCARSLSLF